MTATSPKVAVLLTKLCLSEGWVELLNFQSNRRVENLQVQCMFMQMQESIVSGSGWLLTRFTRDTVRHVDSERNIGIMKI